VKVLTGVTNSRGMRQGVSEPRRDISNDIKVVPAAGLEPARPKPRDFKSPTYPNEVNGLTS
jgi:hypothetical protein